MRTELDVLTDCASAYANINKCLSDRLQEIEAKLGGFSYNKDFNTELSTALSSIRGDLGSLQTFRAKMYDEREITKVRLDSLITSFTELQKSLPDSIHTEILTLREFLLDRISNSDDTLNQTLKTFLLESNERLEKMEHEVAAYGRHLNSLEQRQPKLKTEWAKVHKQPKQVPVTKDISSYPYGVKLDGTPKAKPGAKRLGETKFEPRFRFSEQETADHSARREDLEKKFKKYMSKTSPQGEPQQTWSEEDNELRNHARVPLKRGRKAKA